MIINKLVLKGTSKDYKIEFKQGLNIILGPISTGKSTILNLINYCFGKKFHPDYPEIRKVSNVLLEISTGNDHFTIERQLFAQNKKIKIHYSQIEQLSKNHREIEVSPSQIQTGESISSFLLKKLNLWGINLKEAPGKTASGIDIMSFRDIMWFCYLDQNRIDSDSNFIFEKEIYKNIKFIQVFKVLFNIQDNREASLSDQLKEKKREETELEIKIKTIQDFLKDSNIPNREDLLQIIRDINIKLDDANKDYEKLNKEHKELINFSSIIRNDLNELDYKIKKEKLDLRDKKIFKEKLSTLLGQYREDIRAIEALMEAKNLIDPLNIVRCPVCLEEIEGINNKNNCKLCKNELPKVSISEFEDPTTELYRLKKKHEEILTVIADLEEDIKIIIHEIEMDDKTFSNRSIELENRIKSSISPLTMLREQAYSKIQELKLQIKDKEEKLNYYTILNDIQKGLGQIKVQIDELEKEIKSLRQKIKEPFEVILKNFKNAFYLTLQNLKYPKLDKRVRIDQKLKPYVRDTLYHSLGSLGAIVLITQAWYIAFFKILSKYESKHPKFFMVDSPQSNIGINTKEKEYRDEEIVKGIYAEYLNLIKHDYLKQLIIVDNTPPSGYESYYCIHYTGNPDEPPYGLIDDEISQKPKGD